jgi:hypothetical protein
MKMQNQIGYQQPIIVYIDQKLAFNRHLLSLIKQWDKAHIIEIHTEEAKEANDKCFTDRALQVIDNNGDGFEGPEAVPIILKHLPFGKLFAAMYILPGTMWLTKQFYSLGWLN